MKKLDANHVSDIISLSSMQEGMLFHYLKEPSSTLYFEQVSLHIASRVDLSAFEAAWQHVVSSNEMLRAVYRWEGVKEPVQIILKERSQFLQIIDASSQSTDERSVCIAKIMDDDRNNRFDLTEGAFRVCLYLFAEADYQMLLSHHHILFDGWSTGIILNEFMEAYQLFLNHQQPSAAPKKRYKEFIGLTRNKDKAEQEKFWTGYLQDVNPVWLQDILPASPSGNQAEGNKQLRMELPLALYEEIKQEGKYPVSCYLYAAWALLQAFYTDSRDIVFGTTISGREEVMHGWEDTVGLFINTLPLRLRIDPEETFKDLLEKVFASLNARQLYGSTPLRDIKRYSGMPFEKELFDTILVIENYPLQNNLNSRNMIIDSFSYREETNYPLSISITLWNSIEFVVDYNSQMYSESFVNEAASRYQLILSALVQHPAAPVAAADFLFPEEQRKLLQEFTNTYVAVPAEKTIHRLFEEQADKEPNRIGLRYAGQVYTYRQLNEQANQLANCLIDKGIKPNQLVGICMDRRPELLVAMLGILKSGGAYVPIDPMLPEERIAAMVQDGQIQVIVTVQRYTEAIMGMDGKQPVRLTLLCMDQDMLQGHYGLQDIGRYSREAGISPSTPEDLAYVIYTSGSTGTPKGVMVSHGNVVNFIYGMDQKIGFRHDDKILALTTYSFDIFVLESLLPLCLGMKLVLATDGVQKDPDAILRLIEQESIDVLQATPSRMRMLVDSSLAGCLQQPRKILIGGEAFPEDLYQSLRGITEHQIYNVYGPTETTVWSTVQELEDTMSIGQPIANTGIYILSKDKHLRPLGYPGELCISGKGVAKGYLNQPGLTGDRFITNPYQREERLYCTGDYAYWLPDGRLHFVGRNDGQVKVRGHRIEIGGVESTIKSYPAVKDVVVIEVKEARDSALAAYLVTGGDFVREDFQTFLKSKLPYYAVPAYLYEISEIPYTSNLKVDRKALAHMKIDRMVQPAKLVEPRSKLENEVAEIWKKVLKTEKVGIFNRFFDIGGDSVKVIHLCNELKTRLNMEVPVQTIFDYSTIHEFVSYCNEITKKASGEARQRLQPEAPKAFQPPTLDFQDTDVAIIGMAGRFPGAADKEQFWSNLVNGKEAIKFYTDEELKALGIDSELLNNPKYVRAKGKLEDSDCFDADFFGYTVAEAMWMDPQIRLLHECAWHALEDAGYEPESYPGAIGLYIGSSYNIYWVPEKFSPSLYASDQYQIYNMNSNSFATLIAYRMNLRGPAITVQTACSTSLVAIDRAYKDLLFGDCDIAVAGGAAVTLLDEMGYIHQEGMVLSKDGHCRAFEKKATGTVTGNGVGLVVLKRLKNALADGDHIYSIIKSTAVNNDGNRKAGYSAPSAEGQAAVIQKAIQRSGLGSEQIHYIEAHGTGTVLGDPVEIEGLKRAFNTTKKNYCGLGSVKTNIGHLEAAAGIAGLMKTSMSLQKRMIPASLNCDEINAHIVLEDSPFYVNTQLLDLRNEDNYPLRAGVSSFGQGGSNAHVILEEAPQVDSGPAHRRYVIVTLSAKTEPALNHLKGKVRESFKRNPSVHLADAAYTLKVGRKSFRHRSAFLCTETKEAIDILTAKETTKRWEAVVSEQAPSVVFMFSGQGAEYVNMALDLYRHEPVFRDKLNECLTVLQEISGLRYRDFLFPDEREQQAEGHIHRQSVSQPLHFALEYALAWLLMNWQVEPLSMIGYSIGEYVAACLAGVFSLRDALFLTYQRGVLMEKLPEGLMITVPLQEEALLQMLPSTLSVAAVNDESCIVSGSKDSIADFEARLKSQKIISMRLQISHAGHSKMLDSMVSEFRECVMSVTCNPAAIPFVSSVTGDVITPEEAASPEHWVRHLREPVRFAEGFKKLASQENTLFIEIGPGRNLCTLVQRFIQPDRKQKLLDTLRAERKKTADDEYLLRTAAQLWVYGVPVDWSRFYSNEQRRRVPLPGYPFEKKRYWLRDFRYAAGNPAIEAAAGRDTYGLQEAPVESEASPVQAERSPMSSEAAMLVQITTDIIGGTTIGEDDDLFERGFDSLKVISLISKIADAFRVHLTMHEVFQNPTIRELLPVIQRQAPVQAVTIPKAPEAEYYPVSSQQKRLYALQQFDEDSIAYNIPGAFVLRGKLDPERVEAACGGLIRRHEALRTSFALTGQALVQKVDPDAALAIEYSELPGAGVEETLQGFVQPFRLDQAPLLRIRLVRVADECHVLQIDMHHIISDGLSIELLVRDFLAYYEGRTLAEPRIQYKDYAVWQQNRDSAFWQEERAFWLEQYKDG
ncbi:non-ribosomal peptide synthetase/type I polyketide synthase, partial [Paenibacillus graminis]|uniref:non-ribosomal peptide synthetase/type I polyketide synthase n=1 Tax=Paenibacillus graminis TaxID=189425 RepID=UPI0030C98A1C